MRRPLCCLLYSCREVTTNRNERHLLNAILRLACSQFNAIDRDYLGSTAVFMRMNSHRAHLEHREQNHFFVFCGDLCGYQSSYI